MLTRCTNPKADVFKWYGARGIKVCERWLLFDNFLADMGERPAGLTLDRFPDNEGNYEPGNCRWATKRQQARNTRSSHLVTARGRTACIAEWADISGISNQTILSRIADGWDEAAAVTTPLLRKGTKKCTARA